jgi:hypothetical protein
MVIWLKANENIRCNPLFEVLNINSCGKRLCKNFPLIQAVDLLGYALFVDRISNKILGRFNKILIG